MTTKLVIYGVLILLAINIILFIALLINKIITRKKKIRDETSKRSFDREIEGYLKSSSKEVALPKASREVRIFKSSLLQACNRNNKDDRDRLLEIARETGLVHSEIQQLKNGTDAKKAIAAYSLGVFRATEATEYLLKNKKTKNRELSQCIARALVLVSGTQYLDRIILAIRLNGVSMKLSLLDLISLIDEEEIYPKMEEYLKGEDIFKRVLALEVLGARKDNRVMPYIEEAITSNNKELKVSALKAIIGTTCIDYKNMIHFMNSLKNDKDWEVRAFSAKALSRYSDSCEVGIKILQNMMEDSNWFVRFNSSESLMGLGEAGIVALSETLSSPDEFARNRAWAVLERELSLYDLPDKIKNYENRDYILSNIVSYKNPLEEGALNEA